MIMEETLTVKQKQYLEQPKERISGSEAIVRCLLAEGVDVLYGYPGGAIMPVYDELYKYQDKIHHVLTRHEQGATHRRIGYRQPFELDDEFIFRLLCMECWSR